MRISIILFALVSLLTLTGACGAPAKQASTEDALSAPDETRPTPVNVELPRGKRTAVDRAMEADDPTFGGWDTEALNAASGKQLKRVAAWIESGGREGSVDDLAANDFRSTLLRPAALDEAFSDELMTVRRPSSSLSEKIEFKGRKGLAQALKNAASGFEAPRVKFKPFKIERFEDGFSTRAYLELLTRGADNGAQQSAEWAMTWTLPDGEKTKPLLASIALTAFEEVSVAAPSGALFADYTASAMSGTKDYEELVLTGVPHWLDRISHLEFFSVTGHHGLAVGDVNGDGLEDLYVCDQGGLANRLYLQQPDGTLNDASVDSGVDWLDHTFSALLIDLDNDGDQDLAVATYPRLLLAENDGKGKFSLRGNVDAPDEAYSLVSADYDNDGDLDLYVVTYGSGGSSSVGQDSGEGSKARTPIPYHDANNGGANVLLRNDGGFSFKDVTAQTGLDANNTRYSFAAAWDDFDNDRDLDLYVANDFGRNSLYRNDGGQFVDVAPQAGVEDIATGMSVAWADYNRDGWMDIYVGNMFSAAGNRITFQRQFAPGHPSDEISFLQRTARGNTLFANAGDGSFRDVSEEAGVTMGRWAWASEFADLNNDGWQDLVVSNGFITGEIADDL